MVSLPLRVVGFTDFHSSQSDWSPLSALMYEMLTGEVYPGVGDAIKWPATVPELAKDLMTRVSELPIADIKLSKNSVDLC